jgi:hypothetical protein
VYLELADAEVAHCVCRDGGWQLRLSAARLVDGDGAHAPAAWAPATLSSERAETTPQLDLGACIGRVTHGTVWHGGQRLRQLVVPGALQGAVELELVFDRGEVLRLRCDGLLVRAEHGLAVGVFQC